MELLKDYLSQFKHICWYPSSGFDFRPLLFFTKQWANRYNWNETVFPDCYLYSDCSINDQIFQDIISGELTKLFSDEWTTITVKDARLLEKINVSENREIVYNIPNLYEESNQKFWPPENYGQVVAMTIHVNSQSFGEWDMNVAFIKAENAAFGFEYLLTENIDIYAVYRMNYGYRWAREGVGGRSSGLFIRNLLAKLNVTYFVSDDGLPIDAPDPVVEILYQKALKDLPVCKLKEVLRKEKIQKKTEYYTIPHNYFVNDIVFYKVDQATIEPHKDIDLESVKYQLMVSTFPFTNTYSDDMPHLIHYMIKLYFSRHKDASYTQIKKVFSLKDKSIILKYENINAIDKANWFTDTEEIIRLHNGIKIITTKKISPEEFLQLIVQIESANLVVKLDFHALGDHQ